MTNVRRILLVCDKNPFTSFGRLAIDMELELKKHFIVDTLWLKTPKYFTKDMKMTGFSIEAKSLQSGYFSFRAPFKTLLLEIKPDLVFFIQQGLSFLVPVVYNALPKTKAVVWILDVFPRSLYPHSIKYQMFARLFIQNITKASAVVYGSEYTRIETNKYYKMNAIPNSLLGCSVDLVQFHHRDGSPSKDERINFWSAHQVVGFNGFCLNVSLDEPRKNLETFFEVAAERPQTAFIRVGKITPRVEEMIQKKQLNNIFHFTHISADLLRDFYRYADLLIYPSWFEGFGLPPLESLACGTPVVSASSSSLVENLDGVTPLVSPPDNTQGYVGALDKCLKGETLVDWEKAEALLKYFSVKSVSERLVNFLKTLF